MAKRIEHETVYDAVPVVPVIERAQRAVKRWCVQTAVVAGAVALGDAYMLNGVLFAAAKSHYKASPIQSEAPTFIATEEPIVTEDAEAEAQKILEERFKIPRAVWVTLARRESGFSMFASRFEPGQMKNVRHLSPDPHEQRWYASSHGRFQVMGFHVPRLREKYGVDITPEGLAFDPRQNALAAGIILSECFRDRRVQGHKANRERLRGLFECFNGSGDRARAYAEAAMKELSSELLNDVEVNIEPAHDEMPKNKEKRVDIAALRPEEGEPFIAEARE